MLNGLWAGMLLLGIAYGGFAGTMTEISDGVLEAARESVYLCINNDWRHGAVERPDAELRKSPSYGANDACGAAFL